MVALANGIDLMRYTVVSRFKTSKPSGSVDGSVMNTLRPPAESVSMTAVRLRSEWDRAWSMTRLKAPKSSFTRAISIPKARDLDNSDSSCPR